MKQTVRSAASLTAADLEVSDFSLAAAARLVRQFLANFQGQVPVWKPWLRYAIAAVVAILDLLLEDAADASA